MKPSSLVVHGFKLTTLSLSLMSTMTMATPISLTTSKEQIKDQNIEVTTHNFAIYTEGANALSVVDLLVENSNIKSGLTSIFIDKRKMTDPVGNTNVVVNNSNITVNNADGDGIYVAPVGQGNVNITTDDKTVINIKGQGSSSFGIAVQADKGMTGNITVDNAATINTNTTTGSNNSGLFLQSGGFIDGDVTYTNRGKLTILPGSHGIHLSVRENVTGNISAINTGEIITDPAKNQFSSAGIFIEERANVANPANIINAGTISGFASGILSKANEGVTASTNVVLENGSAIENNTYGINSTGLENTNIVVEKGASLGALNTAIYLNNETNNQTSGNATATIHNEGEITSESGKLVAATANNNSEIALNNQGSMVGYVELLGTGNTQVENAGIWDMSGYKSVFGKNNSLVNTGNLVTANDSAFVQNSIFENVGTFINAGNIILENNRLGDITEIKGNYIGNAGTIKLDTTLEDDNSATDKLIITGAATGSTTVQVNNVGGVGTATFKGILIIETGSSESNKTFSLKDNYISAGSYDYGLYLENEENADNWYLRNYLVNSIPEVPKGQEASTPVYLPVYTPDVGSYLAIETMTNTLFTLRLEDREGASQYQALGDKEKANVWVRAYGGYNEFNSMSNQLKTEGNSFVTQIGSGLVSLGEEDQFNLGAMAGFARYDSKTRSELTGRQSKAKIDGYSVGLYGTWYAHPVEKRGAYIDSWIQWNKFNNKIDSADKNLYNYDSSGITASIEAGGDYLLNKDGKKDWWIQPQAQLIYQGVHADDFTDAQGTNIYNGSDNLQARLGFKTYLEIPTNKTSLTSYRPFLALNYIHNTAPYSVVIDDVRYANESSKDLGEIKVGIEGHISKNSQVWINASYVGGGHSNNTYQGNIGWKYNF